MTTIGDDVKAALAQPHTNQRSGVRPKCDLREQLAKKPKLVADQGQADSDESTQIGSPAVYLMLLKDKEDEDDSEMVAVESHYREEGCNPTTVKNQMKVSGKIYIGEELGQGGYGTVYRAEMESEKSGDPQLCIKVSYHKKKYDDKKKMAEYQEQLNKSLFREADCFKLMSQSPDRCDQVVSMRSYFMSKDLNELFLGLEYCRGANLSRLIRVLANHHYRRMPYKVLLKIMVDATKAVEFLISIGLVHCDIKPSNFLYRSLDSPLKLIDFGCAIRMDDDDLDGHVAGTPEYIAPELLLHEKSGVAKNSDIYGLGALFFHLVTFCRPWSHCSEVKKWRDKEHSGLWDIIRKKFEAPNLEQPADMREEEQLEECTELQERITDEERWYYAKQSLPCDLIKQMLKVKPSCRPSPQKIINNIHSRCQNLALRRTREESFAGKFHDVADSRHSSDVPSTVFSHESDKRPSTLIPTDVRSMHNTSTNPRPKRRADQPSGSDQPPPHSVRRTGSSTKPVQPSDADAALPATVHAVPPESQSPVDAQRAEVPFEGDENGASPMLDRSSDLFKPPAVPVAESGNGNATHLFPNPVKIFSNEPEMDDDDDIPANLMDDLTLGTENLAIGEAADGYSDFRVRLSYEQSPPENDFVGEESAAAVNVVEGGLPAQPDEEN